MTIAISALGAPARHRADASARPNILARAVASPQVSDLARSFPRSCVWPLSSSFHQVPRAKVSIGRVRITVSVTLFPIRTRASSSTSAIVTRDTHTRTAPLVRNLSAQIKMCFLSSVVQHGRQLLILRCLRRLTEGTQSSVRPPPRERTIAPFKH